MVFLIYKRQQAVVSMFPTAQLHAAVHLCTLSGSSCSSLTQASLPLPALHRRPQDTGSQCIEWKTSLPPRHVLALQATIMHWLP